MATIAAPSSAISHAGKPVNGSSPGVLGSAEEDVDTPLTCFASSFCRPALVGGVDAPAVSLVDVVGGVAGPFAVAVVVVLLLSPPVVVGGFDVVGVSVEVVLFVDVVGVSVVLVVLVVLLDVVVVVVVVVDDASAQ
jgi:hypothetical protein